MSKPLKVSLVALVILMLFSAIGAIAYVLRARPAAVSVPRITLLYELTDPSISIEAVQKIASMQLAPVHADVSVRDTTHVAVEIPYPEPLQRASEELRMAEEGFVKSIPTTESILQMLKLTGDDRARAIAAIAPPGTPVAACLDEIARADEEFFAATKKIETYPAGAAPASLLEQRYKADQAYQHALNEYGKLVLRQEALHYVLDLASDPGNASAREVLAGEPGRYPAQAAAIRRVIAAWQAWLAAGGREYADPRVIDDLLIGGDLDFRVALTGAEIGAPDSSEYRDAVKALMKDGPGRRFTAAGAEVVWVEIDRASYDNFQSGNLVLSPDSTVRCILCYDDSSRTLLHNDPTKSSWIVYASTPYRDPSSGGVLLPFSLDPVGAKYIGQMTGTFKLHPMAVIFAGRALSAPTVQSTITEHGVITFGTPTAARPQAAIEKEAARLHNALDGRPRLPLRRVES